MLKLLILQQKLRKKINDYCKKHNLNSLEKAFAQNLQLIVRHHSPERLTEKGEKKNIRKY